MKKIGLGLLFIMLWSLQGVHAQVKIEAPRVRLDKLDTAHVTCDELLKNSKLVSLDPSWIVTRFTISFKLPDGKVYGPFQTQGAALADPEIRVIKRLKKSKAEITIDEINVSHNGKEKYTYPIILRYNN